MDLGSVEHEGNGPVDVVHRITNSMRVSIVPVVSESCLNCG